MLTSPSVFLVLVVSRCDRLVYIRRNLLAKAVLVGSLSVLSVTMTIALPADT